MSTDIGPGDVVEAIRDIRRRVNNGPLLEITVAKGERHVVLAVAAFRLFGCTYCGGFDAIDVGLSGAACICGWKKIGGSEADTLRLFAEDLNAAPVEPERTPQPA